MDASFASKPPRRGFTLVEMLAVIMIIGILVALLLPAIQAARNRAKIAAISLEISQLDMALKRYKEEFGDYPPDFFGVTLADPVGARARGDVLRHLRKAYPRYVLTGTTADAKWNSFRAHVKMATGDPANPNPDTNPGRDINNLDPASALVFWLGGLPGRRSPFPNPSSTKLVRFSANQANPFVPPDGTGSRQSPLFEFDEVRLQFRHSTSNQPVQHDGSGYSLVWPKYFPTTGAGSDALPYVYFKPRANPSSNQIEYGLVDGSTFSPHYYAQPPNLTQSENICVPYLDPPELPPAALQQADPGSQGSRKWRNATSFQIIAGGLDNLYGNGAAGSAMEKLFRYSRSGLYFSENGGDHDNITNFSGGKLEDEM